MRDDDIKQIMRETGMGLMQAINHLRQRTLLQETHKVLSGAIQQARQEAESKAWMLTHQAIAKAAAL